MYIGKFFFKDILTTHRDLNTYFIVIQKYILRNFKTFNILLNLIGTHNTIIIQFI